MPLFLHLGDNPAFRGSSTAPGHTGWIALESVSWGSRRSLPNGTGPGMAAGPTEAVVTFVDPAPTSGIFWSFMEERNLPKVLLDMVFDDRVGVQFEFLKVSLMSFSFGADGRQGPPTAFLQLQSEKIVSRTGPAPSTPPRGGR